jgi:hypothetical protein
VLAQDGLGRLEIPVAFLNVVQELLRPQDRVDQRADERKERARSRARDQERVRKPLPGVVEREDDQGAPDRDERDQRQRDEVVVNRVSES